MLRKSSFSVPMLVLSVLILAAMACYSDSALWPYEMTQPAPSPTFLPTPGADSPAKFVPGSIVTAPRSLTEPNPFLFVADFAEPLSPGATNSAGNCVYNTEYEILYAGILSGEEIYYLIECGGTVGWTTEANLMGPLNFRRGQSALTTNIDPNGAAINNGVFGIHNQQPPVFGPATVQCQVGEVVDIVGLLAPPDTDTIWYQIRCSSNPSAIGWVDQARLFGPLVLPGNGGIGLVLPEVGDIPLYSEATDQSAVVGDCPADSIVTTQNIQQVGDVVYYQVSCGELVGWTLQDPLVEVPYPPSTNAIVFVPVVEEEAVDEEAVDEEVVEEDFEDEGEGGEGDDVAATGPSAPLNENPGGGEDNPVVGECPTDTIVLVNRVTVANENFYYNVSCGAVTGWIDGFFILTSAAFQVGDSVAITEAGFVGTGSDSAFHLGAGPDRVAGARGSIGQCTPNTAAAITDFAYNDTSGTLRVYYLITCQNDADGSELSGWASQDRLQPATVLTSSEDGATEIFGG